jgi:preprotein translocase subunit YajC
LKDVVLSLLPFLLIIVVFWFLLIRPQMRRQRESQRMQAALAVGDNVMLTSGIFGTITAITDEDVRVAVAESVEIKVIRGAVGRVIPTIVDEPADAQGTSPERAEPEENE